MVLEPGKIGRPFNISPKIAPTAQMSTPRVYFVEPRRISVVYVRRKKREER
jgi:hypothetical protein